jgi:methylitaconate Delta-isomerase
LFRGQSKEWGLLNEKSGKFLYRKEENLMEIQELIRCTIMRSGTSKGIFFHRNDLPQEPSQRDKVIMRVFGAPDPREIDGLGGAELLTSKAAVIGPSTRRNCDVDYLFGQVNMVEPMIDWKSNCGNVSAAVGPFAIDEGLVEAVEPVTKVRIHQVNTGKNGNDNNFTSCFVGSRV